MLRISNLLSLTLAASAALYAFQPATPYQNWLNQEVVWIISPDERAAFQRLGTDEERQKFIEQFWLRRDPTPGTQVNELRDEHYRRIAQANDRFGYGSTPGWQSDRGRIYVKFGPPDEKEEHREASPAFEKWRYRLIGRATNVMAEFRDDSGQGQYRMISDPFGTP